MPPKMRSGKAVWVVAAAVIITAIFLIILFAAQTAPNEQESIVLPSAPVDSDQDDVSENAANHNEDHFIVVTNDNVSTVLQTLSRPTAYYQSYTVTVGSDEKQHAKTVELWANEGLLHAEVTDGQQTQSIITNGTDVYLWYDDAAPYISLTLEGGITAEDILGLPDFGAYLSIPQDTVLESDYLLLEDPQVQCIYVSAKNEDGSMSRYWVNLENGLLFQADALESSSQVYALRQTDFELLAKEDEIFINRFVLPDGTMPFTEGTEGQQP